jgi:phosphoribosyl 1,2-cyclic phosphodiesterase
MLGFCPLASGSKGNALYLGTPKTKLLIDAGLSYRQIVLRLSELSVSVDEIDAVLVTHEHTDHVRGLQLLSERHDIPVFTNSETAKGIVETINFVPKFKIFSTGESFEFGDVTIHPFSIQHDTFDPVAFVVHWQEIKLGICTDLGFVSTLVKMALRNCHYLYIEANHQPSMVHASRRPLRYKQRVLGRQGHLSNQACATLLEEIAHPDLKHVYLAHLSSECNSADLALEIAQEALTKGDCQATLSIAHQDQVSTPILWQLGPKLAVCRL